MSVATPPRGYDSNALMRRRKWLQKQINRDVDFKYNTAPEIYRGIIENYIGSIELPMGVAGPLKISGTYAKGEFYIPLCTLEGTLVFSMTRGLYLTALAGGISTTHLQQNISRSPVFVFSDSYSLENFAQWIEDHYDTIKKEAESTTQHGKLIKINTHIIPEMVVLDFIYETSEAAGQNMITIATQKACGYILEMCKKKFSSLLKYFVESGFNGEKKVTFRNAFCGRGHSVYASCKIPERYVKKILRVSVDDLVEHFHTFRICSRLSGVSSLHFHVANALSAIYLAHGQDVACIAENSISDINFNKSQNDLKITLRMPSITVGTVGGGTRLPAQQKNLDILKCTGKDSSKKFSEIICACCLALELSLFGAVVSNEFASAHQHYGR